MHHTDYAITGRLLWKALGGCGGNGLSDGGRRRCCGCESYSCGLEGIAVDEMGGVDGVDLDVDGFFDKKLRPLNTFLASPTKEDDLFDEGGVVEGDEDPTLDVLKRLVDLEEDEYRRGPSGRSMPNLPPMTFIFFSMIMLVRISW